MHSLRLWEECKGGKTSTEDKIVGERPGEGFKEGVSSKRVGNLLNAVDRWSRVWTRVAIN